jgi:hypothetical protein
MFPSSGAVFSMRVDVPGLPVNFFVDSVVSQRSSEESELIGLGIRV